MTTNDTEPQAADVAELLAFLPVLEGPGQDDGACVRRFFDAASRPCWVDRHDVPAIERQHLLDADFVAQADLPQLKALLTFCMRSERFSEGAWLALAREAHVDRWLARLAALRVS